MEPEVLENENLGLQSPWYKIWSEIKMLFKGDDDINVTDIEKMDEKITDDDGIELTVYQFIIYADSDKRMALRRLLPVNYQFGNILLHVIIDSTDEENITPSDYDDFNTVFTGNSCFSRMMSIQNEMGMIINYCLFKPEVVVFYDDDITSPWGAWTGLWSELARDVFTSNPIYYAIDLENGADHVIFPDDNGESSGAANA
jgi:hypothetical protein